ncbi:unnamed protein product [Closterium sp. Yama58-4]|nr:unnamed protein product [Closterium sp. Yama58-4]
MDFFNKAASLVSAATEKKEEAAPAAAPAAEGISIAGISLQDAAGYVEKAKAAVAVAQCNEAVKKAGFDDEAKMLGDLLSKAESVSTPISQKC